MAERLWKIGAPQFGFSFHTGREIVGTQTNTLRLRQFSYELSLLDTQGRLRRIEYSPTIARARKEKVVDVSHQGMREIPSTDPVPTDGPVSEARHSWMASLAA
jgi:hypothetical protein